MSVGQICGLGCLKLMWHVVLQLMWHLVLPSMHTQPSPEEGASAPPIRAKLYKYLFKHELFAIL